MKLNEVLKTASKEIKSFAASESPYTQPTGYLSSGSYAINRVLTGDIYKGFPIGRISTLFGASSSGKSLVVANTIVDALNNGTVDKVYYFDTEGGMLVDYINQRVPDDKRYMKVGKEKIDRIDHKTIRSIEQCSIEMTKLYDILIKAREEYIADPDNNDDVRVLVVLDSYGALVSAKQLNDAIDKEKMVADMGVSAKLRNALIRSLMMAVVQSNATLLIVNHEYKDPAAMFASKIHNMAGGMGIEFASHVILQCEKLLIKSTDTEFLTGLESEDDNVGFFKGNKMKFFVKKNRIVKPCFEAAMYLDFNTGISTYDGLIEDAVKLGFLEEVRGGYICKSYSDKRVSYKDLVSNKEIWDTFIEDYNKKSIEVMGYSNSNSRELDKIESDIDASEAV